MAYFKIMQFYLLPKLIVVVFFLLLLLKQFWMWHMSQIWWKVKRLILKSSNSTCYQSSLLLFLFLLLLLKQFWMWHMSQIRWKVKTAIGNLPPILTSPHPALCATVYHSSVPPQPTLCYRTVPKHPTLCHSSLPHCARASNPVPQCSTPFHPVLEQYAKAHPLPPRRQWWIWLWWR